MDTEKIIKTEEQWRKELDPETYHVTREKGTEAPFSGKYWDNHEQGMYHCSNCGQELFASKDKFDSGTGWPSFTCPIESGTVKLEQDVSHGMVRTEVICSRCGAHLGHVFDDGPKSMPNVDSATGKRFCINSLSLDFEQDEK